MLRHPWETIGKKAWSRKQFRKRMRAGEAAPPVRNRLSLILCVGDAPKYLDTFLSSAVRQSTGLENVEIIIVDDGAGDRSGAIVRRWQRRFPKAITYIHQEDQGLSAARNTGLAHATGDWVSFGDPDDFLDPNLFARIDAEISGAQGQAPVMIAARPVSYQQDADRFRTDHPLDYRFADTRTELPAADPGNHIQPQVSSAWLDRAAIERHGLRFDPRIGPAFEDAHFVNRLLLREPERNVVFLRDANTYYRTRPNAGVSAEWYIDQFRHGYLDLLEQARAARGVVPRFIQRTVLYGAFGHIKHLVDRPEQASRFAEDQKGEIFRLLNRIFSDIDEDVINGFELGKCHEEDKVALLALFKGAMRPEGALYARHHDDANNLLQLSYYSGGTPPHVTVTVNGTPVAPLMPTKRQTLFIDRPYFTEHRFWIPALPEDEIGADVDGVPAHLKYGRVFIGKAAPLSAIIKHLERSKASAAASRPLRNRLSLVVPTYNVGAYLDEFLSSVVRQSTGLENVEIIIVDDGATDQSGAIARRWQSCYPDAITYIHQENQGLSAARNTGLTHATGDWVSFCDPDDFLDANYFATVDAEISRRHSRPLLMVSARPVFYHEDTDRFSNDHPLDYRFAQPRTELPSSDLRNQIQLQVCSAWFDRAAIERHGLRFDSRIRPTFEDGHFVNRLLLREPDRNVVFLRDANYFYRKRANASSLVDGAKLKVEWYSDQFRYGYVDLLEQARAICGQVPRFVQRTVLYDVFWRFRYLVDHPERTDFLTEEQKSEFLRLLDAVFSHIDESTINDFNLGKCHEEHKIALLAMFKDAVRPQGILYCRQYDPANGLLQLSYCSGGSQPEIVAAVNGNAVAAQMPSKRQSLFMDRLYFTEHRFWIPVAEGDEISASFDGKPARLKYGGKTIGAVASLATIVAHMQKPQPKAATLDASMLELRMQARSEEARARYGDCWLLMDREDAADDNAEHLYRHLLQSGRSDRAFYVLRRDSPDWDRLAADGFRLLEYQSESHFCALTHATFVISSHIDHHILWPWPANQCADMVDYRFIFLQHGVILHDLSQWLNTKPISLFVTSTEAEYESIAGYDSNYIFSEKEVLLSGLPRHDRLLARRQEPRKIMIMPTWRRSLTDESVRVGMARGKIANFEETDYARHWGALLRSERLRRIAEEAGLGILFCPHPNMSMYIDDFDVPGHVEVRHPLAAQSLQASFTEAGMMITDYSSVAFEMAYLERPVLYYHFDIDQLFSTGHFYKRGYFEYGKDGFGPVETALDALLDQVEATCAGREKPDYAVRRERTFPFRDGHCCQRVHEAILRLEEPARPGRRTGVES